MSPPAPSSLPPTERLNAAEREALALLAEGHTAKSIATATGRSVHAVNERLRDARRKTGIGSSRELARLLKAREGRDKSFELPTGGDAPERSASRTRSALRLSGKEWWNMAVVTVGAALVAWMVAQTGAPDIGDPRLSQMFSDSGDKSPRNLHNQLIAETREQPWAEQTEQLLRIRFDEVLGVEKLSVTCGRATCEVVGEITARPDRINATMQQLQGGSLFRQLGRAGLKNESAMFGPDRLFVSYWTRTE